MDLSLIPINGQNEIILEDISHLGIRYQFNTRQSNLNARSGPGISHDIIGKFPKGTLVDLVKRHNALWYLVRYDNLEAYCHTDYLEQV